MNVSLLHVREVTSNCTNSLTNEDTASYNDSTKILNAYGIVTKTSGGRKLKHGTSDVLCNTDNGTHDSESCLFIHTRYNLITL